MGTQLLFLSFFCFPQSDERGRDKILKTFLNFLKKEKHSIGIYIEIKAYSLYLDIIQSSPHVSHFCLMTLLLKTFFTNILVVPFFLSYYGKNMIKRHPPYAPITYNFS